MSLPCFPVQQLFCKKNIAISDKMSASVHTKVYTKIHDLPAEIWDNLLQSKHYYLNRNYLTALEAAASDKSGFRYLLIYQGEQPIMIVYCQIIPFDVRKTGSYTQTTEEDNTFSLKNMAYAAFNGIKSRIKVNLLVCGNLYLSGEYAFARHPTLSEKTAYQYLIQALTYLSKNDTVKISAILLKDFYKEAGHPVEVFEEGGYHLFHADPIMKMNLPIEWKQFEDYSSGLSSKYRQRMKSAYKKSQPLTTKSLTLEEIISLNDQLFPLFENVVRKSSFNLKDTPKNYFIELKRQLQEDIIFTAYYDNEVLVGFKTVIRAGDHLEAHFLGYMDEQNHHYKMYLRMLYDMIKTGIEEGFREISFGRTAMEIKTTVGAVPHPANLYLKLTNPVFNRLGKSVIENIRQESFVPRHPFKGQEHLETRIAEAE